MGDYAKLERAIDVIQTTLDQDGISCASQWPELAPHLRIILAHVSPRSSTSPFENLDEILNRAYQTPIPNWRDW